jgi:divalent metal cation (Fe/Co/Zn/Cd) transporter
MNPQPLDAPMLAVAVLVLAVFTNGYAVSLSARKLGFGSGGLRKVFQSLNQPLVKGAFLRDVIGTFTSIVGLVALLLYNTLGLLVLDALGALFAAVCMGAGSVVLMAQARALITGRSLPPEALQNLRAAILADPMVVGVNGLVAIYAGAFEVLIDADLDLNTTEIEAVLESIEHRVRTIMPEITRVRVLLNSL